MALSEIIPNILAMICSFGAMLLLGMLALKIGGSLGKVLKLLIVGIFFSVFLHAGFELVSISGMISNTVLMRIMGSLLTIGSIFFMLAALSGLKALK